MIRSFRKLYILFSPKSRWKILLLFGLMIVGSLLELLGIGSIPLFVSILTNPDKISKYPMVESVLSSFNINSRKDLLYFGAIFMVTAFVFKNLFLVYFAHYRTRFIFNQKVEFEQRLFHAYLFAPYNFILNNHSSRLLRNIGGEINMIITRVLLPMMKILLNGFLILTILILLLVVNPMITLAVIGILSVAGFVFLRIIRKKIKEYGRDEQKHRASMIKSVLQGLGGVKESRVLNRENNFFMKMNRSAIRLAKAGYYREFVGAIPKPFIETIAIIVFLLISMLLYVQGKTMDTLLTTLALFGAAFYRLMPTSQQMVTQISLFQYGLVSIDPVYRDMSKLDYLKKHSITLDKSEPEKFPFRQEISLNKVSFSYPGTTTEVIHKMDLKINKGAVIAFVGPSGAGKTTLVDLILGLLKPTAGSIAVDGKDIHDNLNGWNMNIGYIPQNIYLTDDSIKNNVAFGLEEEGINEERLNGALKEAQLKEMVDSLPQGVNTIIGEHGTRISGGQRQRLGIARALYNQPELLIMDEATSSLDSITEKFIIESIEMLKNHRTIIMIAHRLTTVRNADIIYFMKNGKISDSGTYEELLESNKEFKALAGMS